MVRETDTFPIYSDPKTVTWERLEAFRLKNLGLSNSYSRHFNVRRIKTCIPVSKTMSGHGNSTSSAEETTSPPFMTTKRSKTEMADILRKSNSLAPFATLGKPTCGYFFSRETDNKKRKFGIPPSDLVKWRHAPIGQTATQ